MSPLRTRKADHRPAVPLSRALSLSTSGVLGWIILCRGHWPVHCRMFSCVPGLCPLDASNTSCSVVTIRNVSRHCQLSPGRPDRPRENHRSGEEVGKCNSSAVSALVAVLGEVSQETGGLRKKKKKSFQTGKGTEGQSLCRNEGRAELEKPVSF